MCMHVRGAHALLFDTILDPVHHGPFFRATQRFVKVKPERNVLEHARRLSRRPSIVHPAAAPFLEVRLNRQRSFEHIFPGEAAA